MEALAANVWVGGKRKARAVFGEMGTGLSPYPYPLLFAQDEHELLLIERLAECGVHVERERELVGFDQSADGVQARVRDAAGSEERCEAGYLPAATAAIRRCVRDWASAFRAEPTNTSSTWPTSRARDRR